MPDTHPVVLCGEGGCHQGIQTGEVLDSRDEGLLTFVCLSVCVFVCICVCVSEVLEGVWRSLCPYSLQVTRAGSTLSPSWARHRVFDREVATLFCAIVKEETWAKVHSVTEKKMAKAPPAGLKTVELLRAASAGLRIGPHTAMIVAERLYTKVCAHASHTIRCVLVCLTLKCVHRCLSDMLVPWLLWWRGVCAV